MSKDKFRLFLVGILIGLVAGISIAALLITTFRQETAVLGSPDDSKESNASQESTTEVETASPEPTTPEQESSSQTESTVVTTLTSEYPNWNPDTAYVGGTKVIYQSKLYRAKWWTQNEKPGVADVWEDTLESPTPPTKESNTASVPNDPVRVEDFKVVGYYPSWQPNQTHKIRYDVVTHVIYSFAIPTKEGTLRPLDNPETAKEIIASAKKQNVKVLLAIGGWSYQDTPLETTFLQATETEEKRKQLVQEILTVCTQYGFDGIDMDWEHPRVDGVSGKQYEAFMLSLSKELHAQGKLLTSAVVSGATADGTIYYDAAAHSDKVLSALDWIHVMAYDGGDGERHSSYEFALNSAQYWKNTRKLPSGKVVLGMPFYGRPGWNSYEELLAADIHAADQDTSVINGITSYYNGIPTIQKKTEYALTHLGGVMVWEITQDTSDPSKSLFSAIKETIQKNNKDV